MCVDIIVDSGSSILLTMESFAKNIDKNQKPASNLKFVSAAGEPIPVIKQVEPVHVSNTVCHSFIVVHFLIWPRLLHRNGILLDFTTTPLTIQNQVQQADCDLSAEFCPILDALRNVLSKVCAVTSINEPDEYVIDTYAIFMPISIRHVKLQNPRSWTSIDNCSRPFLVRQLCCRPYYEPLLRFMITLT